MRCGLRAVAKRWLMDHIKKTLQLDCRLDTYWPVRTSDVMSSSENFTLFCLICVLPIVLSDHMP